MCGDLRKQNRLVISELLGNNYTFLNNTKSLKKRYLKLFLNKTIRKRGKKKDTHIHTHREDREGGIMCEDLRKQNQLDISKM